MINRIINLPSDIIEKMYDFPEDVFNVIEKIF